MLSPENILQSPTFLNFYKTFDFVFLVHLVIIISRSLFHYRIFCKETELSRHFVFLVCLLLYIKQTKTTAAAVDRGIVITDIHITNICRVQTVVQQPKRVRQLETVYIQSTRNVLKTYCRRTFRVHL